jgi:Nucleotidyl transferase AbiEii toxin, Type IV TA system
VTVRQYATPLAFKQALEQRLRSASATGTDFARRPQLLVFDRFLMRYEGFRHRAECRLAGMIYGRPFGVDVAFGDPLVGEPDVVVGDDILGFAGIAPPSLRLYPVVSHIAEKLHALTMPRPRPNSRVRDLPDLALLATTGPLDGAWLRRAIDRTFEFRGTHPVPVAVPPPPAFWAAAYAAMASTDELSWRTLGEVFEAVSSFLNPVLQTAGAGSWEPTEWRWK